MLSTLVGSSEAIRLLSDNFNKSSNAFNEWLGGLIDGDGCFTYSKKGYVSLEITVDLRDELALHLIKQKFGGSIKLRAGTKSVRYRLHDKTGLIKLIHAVNGELRNPIRMLQFIRVCSKYDIKFIEPLELTFNNNWFAGFIDADGTVIINKTNMQLSISVSHKNIYLLNILKKIYGGNIYKDNSKYESFKLYFTSKEDIFFLLSYFKLAPLRTAKKHRIYLIKDFYELKNLKTETLNSSKAWITFFNKWSSYNSDKDMVL